MKKSENEKSKRKKNMSASADTERNGVYIQVSPQARSSRIRVCYEFIYICISWVLSARSGSWFLSHSLPLLFMEKKEAEKERERPRELESARARQEQSIYIGRRDARTHAVRPEAIWWKSGDFVAGGTARATVQEKGERLASLAASSPRSRSIVLSSILFLFFLLSLFYITDTWINNPYVGLAEPAKISVSLVGGPLRALLPALPHPCSLGEIELARAKLFFTFSPAL